MNPYPALAYVKHLLTSRSSAGHGVHSPAVYDFLTSVVRNKTDNHIVREVEILRREMLSDRRIITVRDLGKGSLKMGGEKRSLHDIARHTALPRGDAMLLGRIAGAVQKSGFRVPGSGSGDDDGENHQEGAGERGVIMELGTSLGISTLSMALSAPAMRIITVEGCPSLAEIAASNMLRHGASNVTVLSSDFSSAISTISGKGERIEMTFIDGDHRGEALENYIRLISDGGERMTVVADDIHLSADMYRSWKRMAEGGVAGAAIEMHRFGILFRFPNLTPGYYKIRR